MPFPPGPWAEQLYGPQRFTPDKKLFLKFFCLCQKWRFSCAERAVGIPSRAPGMWFCLLMPILGSELPAGSCCCHVHAPASGLGTFPGPKKAELAQMRWEPAMGRVNFTARLWVVVFFHAAGGGGAAPTETALGWFQCWGPGWSES